MAASIGEVVFPSSLSDFKTLTVKQLKAWLKNENASTEGNKAPLLAVLAVDHTSSDRCSRDFSRMVRHEIDTKILPHYKDMNIDIPDHCQLNPNRDVYLKQEENIIQQTATRYVCNFCGKAFISKHFMGLHFDNKHPEYVRKEADAVCFADMCDIARCDFLSGRKPDDFWEVSLCLEDEMMELYNKCESVVKDCTPTDLTVEIQQELYDRLLGLCSFLTCKTYWQLPEQRNASDALYIALKIFQTVLLGFSMFVYYFVAYQHFCVKKVTR